MAMKTCQSCKRELNLLVAVSRKEECPFCRSDLHTCLNCSFFDSKASRQCREPAADPVKEKQKANFCDFFSFREERLVHGEAAVEQARKQLGELFKR